MTEQAAELKKVKIEVPGPEGANSEVFWGEGATEADAYQAAAAKVAEGKAHATAKIHQQQQELERLQALQQAAEQQPAPAALNGFDKNAYFNTLYENPEAAFDMLFERRFGMSTEEATQQWERLNQVEQIVQARTVAAQFAAKHPELLQVTPEQDRQNANIIEGIITENGWKYTDRNMEAAYAVAIQSGKLKLPSQNTDTQPPAPPATLTSSSGGGDTTVDEATLLAGMTLDQKRAYYSAKASRARQGS